MSAKATAATQKRRFSPLVITSAIVIALIIAFTVFAGIMTDVLWYDQLGFIRVWATQWIAAAIMFLIGFFAMAIPLWLNLVIAYRKRPVYARINSQVERYKEAIEPLRKLVTLGAPAAVGAVAGGALAANWRDVILWLNSEATGVTDPQFGIDNQFYLFTLPVLQGAIVFAQTVLVISLLGALLFNLVFGGIAITGKDIKISKATRVQTAIIAVLWLLFEAGRVWVSQYATLTRPTGLITGASYTDVNAVIPGLQILAGIVVIVALLFVMTAATGKWRLSITGAAVLIVASIVLSGGYPWGVQEFRVKPDEKSLEAEYIDRNIKATRAAYGIDKVETERYDAVTDATAGALRDDAVATANIRIMDPAVIATTFAQLEQSKQYYSFPDSLSVDRYDIDGKIEDTVSAPREINVENQNGWYNQTLVYTHGYGLVAAYGNQRSASGEPVFLENGIPTSGKLGEFEPRIYFGLESPEYSIVGGKRDKPIEVDYPADNEQTAEAAATGETNDSEAAKSSETKDVSGERQNLTTFAGEGGPVLNGVFEKLIYAMKFQDLEVLLSGAVVDGSQILYQRNPVDRVQAVAPYLTIDKQPYASVVDGRVVWIIDGYTTSSNYPYSKVTDMSRALIDADNTTVAPENRINYIRNSVKATVDAYDGKVTLYAWDTEDPILQAWSKVYPDSLTGVEKMSAELLAHVRYPNDLFKVQREMLGEYHVTDAGAFYSNEDAWRTPSDPVTSKLTSEQTPTQEEAVVARASAPAQPPYYLTLSPGKGAEPNFSIYSTYIPKQSGDNTRDILTGYLAADSNAGGEAGKINKNYGKLKMLVLPKSTNIYGPSQVQNSFNTDPSVSQVLNILRQGETTQVISGNLLTLPIGGGLLYVQPVYVQGKTGRGFPLLQKVLVSFGDKIAFENTLDEALDKLFEGNSGASAGDTDTVASDRAADGDAAQPTDPGAASGSGDTAADTGDAADTKPADGGSATDLSSALRAMQDALQERDEAMKRGDWTAYGEADAKLKAALEQALKLSN